jgi:hypothetical protein
LTVRVIIADAFGCLVREWKYGQGISGSNAVQFVGGCRIAWVLRFDTAAQLWPLPVGYR